MSRSKESGTTAKKRNVKKGVKLFCVLEKEGEVFNGDDTKVTPLQIGDDVNSLADLKTRDEFPKITELSNFWGRIEALYYVWKSKNTKDARYKGQFMNDYKLPYDSLDVEKILTDKFAICSFNTVAPSIYRLYGIFLNDNIDILRKIVIDNYPEYEKSWNSFIDNNQYLLYFHGFIMKSSEYDKFAKWLFDILKKFLKEKGFKTNEEVVKYVEANGTPDLKLAEPLAEMLQTLYFFHNFRENIYLTDYVKD